MSTNSLILPPGSSVGAYCHWDGYPEHMQTQLTKIIARDGLDAAVKVLTQDYYGWSSIDADPDGTRISDRLDSVRFVAVPGYGIAYTHIEEPELTSREGFWGFVYRLTELGGVCVGDEGG